MAQDTARHDVTDTLAHATAMVTTLVEGMIDPFASKRHETVWHLVAQAQELLEHAEDVWHKRRKK